jgi:formyl-CoA transferase
LDELIEIWTKDLNKVELMKQLQKISIPAGVVNSSPEWLSDEHLLERDYFFGVEELDAGYQSYDGSPVKFYNDRGYDSWIRSPGLGEHYDQILGDILGYSSLDITELFEQKIIVDSPPI